MSINKCVVTKGFYEGKELRLLVSYDEKDNPVDVINLDNTLVGTVCLATVEKVLKDIDACILKLSNGEKGFIENRKLNPEDFVERHSENKLVCQSDKFYVAITQDKKDSKPCSCKFVSNPNKYLEKADFIDYYLSQFADDGCLLLTDLEDVVSKHSNSRLYEDQDLTLWNLYDFTKILKRITSKMVHLKNGGNLVIEKTEALTVIDVNSSKNGGKGSFYDTNIQALEEVAREIRLRSISGIIIIDLLKVSREEQKELIKIFKDFSKDDISSVSVHGITNLGLLEVTRSRMLAPFNI